MEIGNMFTEQKWNILKCLAYEPLSPMQLSEKLGSTMANISQQLKLLEAASLVQKKKIKNRDKGKPRSLFSLSNDYVFLVPTMQQFAAKRLLKANEHHKIMLRIWFLKNEALHYPLEKLYWRLEKNFHAIESIAVDESKNQIVVVSDNLDIKKSFEGIEASITLMPTRLKSRLLESSAVIFDRAIVHA